MVQKIFNNWLFRVMCTWFGNYVQSKFKEQVIKWQGAYSIINVGTHENVEAIVNAFAAYPDAETLTVIQQWAGETEPTPHTVYRNIVYIGGTEV